MSKYKTFENAKNRIVNDHEELQELCYQAVDSHIDDIQSKELDGVLDSVSKDPYKQVVSKVGLLLDKKHPDKLLLNSMSAAINRLLDPPTALKSIITQQKVLMVFNTDYIQDPRPGCFIQMFKDFISTSKQEVVYTTTLLLDDVNEVSIDDINKILRINNINWRVDELKTYSTGSLNSFFDEEFQDKTYDFILGNPPYQSGNGQTGKKKYVEITARIFESLTNKTTIVHLLTPDSILDETLSGGDKKFLNGVFQDYLCEVDYQPVSVFKDVAAGVDVISWKCDMSRYSTSVKITNPDGSSVFVSDYNDVATGSKMMGKVIFNKVSYLRNGRHRLGLFQAGNVESANMRDESEGDFIYPVFTNPKKGVPKTKYTDKPWDGEADRLLVPRGSGYRYGCHLSNLQTTSSAFSPRGEYTAVELSNMKSYLESNLIIFFVDIFFHSAYNTNITRIPMLDFTRPWTDEQLYSEFSITPDEVVYLNRWLEDNPSDLG